MHVQLVLNQPQGQYTNLDVISGRVVLRAPSPGNVSFIVVKLEGESRTRLLAPPRPGTNEKPKPELEIHKVLYKVQRVWPPPNAQFDPTGKTSFVLGPGQYEYPFEFKLPFNNACSAANSMSSNISFGGLGLEIAKTPKQHVKNTLPPSVYFPGEAEIRYYVKVTVNRPSLLKENPRAFANFNFVPIEPPRPITEGEAYARRQHQFLDNPYGSSGRKNSSLGGMFKSKPGASPTLPISPGQPVRLSLDARLPNPGILTCGQDIPLRILFKQLSERSEAVYIQTLQIELVGHTKVRAHGVYRTESTSWVITTQSNLQYEIGSLGDAVGTETELTKEFWYGRTLPDTVAPSFITCNISRSYELVISLGLCYGKPSPGKDQFVALNLRLEVEVFSGIKPPDELLKRIAGKESDSRPQAPVINPNPYATSARPNHGPPPEAAPPGYDEPPPSYEDAVAADLPPLAGPRPDYRPPQAQPGGQTLFSDQKM